MFKNTKDIFYLFKENYLYSLSVLINQLSNFVIIVICTRLLSQLEYGYLALIKPLIIIFGSIYAMGLSPAFIQWRWRQNMDLNKLRNTILSSLYFTSILFVITLIISLKIISPLNNLISLKLIFTLALLSFTFLQNNELIHFYRVENKKNFYLIFTTIRAFLQLFFVSIVIYFNRYSFSYLEGIALSELTLFIFLSKFKFNFYIDKNLLFSLLKFGLPNALIISSSFLLNFADRYMLAFFMDDLSQIAIYDVGYVFSSSIIGLISRPSNLYIQPKVTKLNYENGINSAKKELYKFQYNLLFILIFVGFLAILSSKFFIGGVFSKNYLDSSNVISPIIFAYIINGLFIPYITFLHIIQKTYLIACSTIIAFIANIILNIIFIL